MLGFRTLILVLLLAPSAPPVYGQGRMTIWGIGTEPCEKVFANAESRRLIRPWIEGYKSAVARREGTYQEARASDQLFEMVEERCRSRPRDFVVHVVEDVLQPFKRR
jgi:hypothetical protein